jgi:hypothetical protein
VKLREEILKEHSKKQCTRIVKWVGNDQERFDELFNLFLNDEYRVVQRAAWPMGNCVMAHPGLITKNWKRLVNNLKKQGLHPSVKRNSIRLMCDIDIPGKYHGEIMNICFGFLESPTETLAVKVFSMTVLGKLVKQYPEIAPELKILIEDQFPQQTAGFRSRGKKTLAMLDKLQSAL